MAVCGISAVLLVIPGIHRRRADRDRARIRRGLGSRQLGGRRILVGWWSQLGQRRHHRQSATGESARREQLATPAWRARSRPTSRWRATAKYRATSWWGQTRCRTTARRWQAGRWTAAVGRPAQGSAATCPRAWQRIRKREVRTSEHCVGTRSREHRPWRFPRRRDTSRRLPWRRWLPRWWWSRRWSWRRTAI
jgi:hypothetical protein